MADKPGIQLMRQKLFILTGILACLLTPESNAAEIDDHIFSGSKFVQEKKYTEAEREFRTALQINPDSAKANLFLGLLLANTGDLDGAIQYTGKAVSIEPSYTGYYNLGLVQSNKGNFSESVSAYEKAVKINSKSYEAWHQLGKVYAAALQFKEAVEAYKKAASLNAKFPDAYQGMGSAYYWSGDLTAALQQVEALNKLGFSSHALQLEKWIKDKETKKKKNSSAQSPKK